MADGGKSNDQLKRIIQLLQEILAALRKQSDVAGFIVSTSKPISGEKQMAGKIKTLGDAATQAMLDDQKDTMSIAPVNSQGQPTALPSGSTPPTYAAAPGTAVTLTPAADGLSCVVTGVKGQSGTEVVTASFTNADGTVATGTATYTITVDPTELDVASFTVTTDTPVAQ